MKFCLRINTFRENFTVCQNNDTFEHLNGNGRRCLILDRFRLDDHPECADSEQLPEHQAGKNIKSPKCSKKVEERSKRDDTTGDEVSKVTNSEGRNRRLLLSGKFPLLVERNLVLRDGGELRREPTAARRLNGDVWRARQQRHHRAAALPSLAAIVCIQRVAVGQNDSLLQRKCGCDYGTTSAAAESVEDEDTREWKHDGNGQADAHDDGDDNDVNAVHIVYGRCSIGRC